MSYSTQDLARMTKIRKNTEKILLIAGEYIVKEKKVIKRRNKAAYPIVREYREMLREYSAMVKAFGNGDGSIIPQDPMIGMRDEK